MPEDLFDQAADQVSKNTLALLPMWMSNWAANLQKARAGDSLDKLFQRPPSERVLVVGRGPSIRKHGHLDMLAKRPFPGHVVASDGALPLLCEKGVVPYLSMTVDGNEVISKWFKGPTARAGSKVRVVLPVTVHPKTVAQCASIGAHVYWYIPEMDVDPMKGTTEVLQLQTCSPANPTGLSRHNGAGNCGLSAIVLATNILRAKEVVLIGMDGGYPPDTPLEELHYHDGMLRSCGYDEKQLALLYRDYFNPKLGYPVSDPRGHTVLDPVFEVYRKTFDKIAEACLKSGIKVVNCTEGGCLLAEGVEFVPFNDYLNRVSSG